MVYRAHKLIAYAVAHGKYCRTNWIDFVGVQSLAKEVPILWSFLRKLPSADGFCFIVLFSVVVGCCLDVDFIPMLLPFTEHPYMNTSRTN